MPGRLSYQLVFGDFKVSKLFSFDMKLFFVFALLGAVYALVTRCQITTNGVLFKPITDQDVKEEVMLADQRKLSSEFYMCGRTQSCSNVVKYQDTKEYQTVNGKEELKKVNRAVVTWEKGKLKFILNYI